MGKFATSAGHLWFTLSYGIVDMDANTRGLSLLGVEGCNIMEFEEDDQ